MAPLTGRTRQQGVAHGVVPKEKWVEGTSFQFKKTPEFKEKKLLMNRRQSQMLKRLDIQMNVDSTLQDTTSPSKLTLRRTRRMSMAKHVATPRIEMGASASKIPRSASQKQMPNGPKPPAATRMLATSTSRPKLVKNSNSSKIPGSKKNAGKDAATAEASDTNDSWIDKISSPAVFYKSAEMYPQLKGAQRRKSYTTANIQVDTDDQGKKRERTESPAPAPIKKLRTSAPALPRSKSSRPTTASKSSSALTGNKTKTTVNVTSTTTEVSTESVTSVKTPQQSLRRSTRKTPAKITANKNLKLARKTSETTLIKSQIFKSTISRAVNSKSTSAIKPQTKVGRPSNKAKTPEDGIKKPQTPNVTSVTPEQLQKSATKSPISITLKCPSPNASKVSPVVASRSALTRLTKCKSNKKVVITGASPTVTDFRRDTPKVIRGAPTFIHQKNTAASMRDIGKLSVNLTRYTSSTCAAPSPLKRLVSASRANPFTPRPEAQPSKLLKQTIKNKLATEITTLKKVSSQLGFSALVDPRVSTVRTPTRVLLREAGFVSGSTPASSPDLPPTPTSARRMSRSGRMVASARRQMTKGQGENVALDHNSRHSPCRTPLNSTPRASLFSSFTSSNGATESDELSNAGDESSVADFTESVHIEDATEVECDQDSETVDGGSPVANGAMNEQYVDASSPSGNDNSHTADDSSATDDSSADNQLDLHNDNSEDIEKREKNKGYCVLM